MKKLLIILMVTLMVIGVSFSSQAYLLERNSDWKIRVTNMYGQYIDIYSNDQTIIYYSYNKEIDSRHHTLYYKATKKNDWEDDKDDEVIFKGETDINNRERSKNNPGINLNINGTGFYVITLKLNTGEKASSVIYVYDPEEGDFESGVEPGTAFQDLPEDWVCPWCGAEKEYFEAMD
mgnify:CR=1 FL=1